MSKEEIIKELDKQNKQLGIELSLTKDKLNKTLFLLDKIKEYINRTEINSVGTPLAYTEIGKELLELLEKIE